MPFDAFQNDVWTIARVEAVQQNIDHLMGAEATH